jgi:hypothetical protein
MALGGTVRELQRRMTTAEFSLWLRYRKKHGPMNDVRRHDRPAALLAYVASRLGGNKCEIKDFMPFGVEEDREASLSDIMNALGAVNIVKPR